MFSTILCLKLSANISETVFLPVRNSVLESENKNQLKMCVSIPGNGNMKISSNRTILLYRYEIKIKFQMNSDDSDQEYDYPSDDSLSRYHPIHWMYLDEPAIECENCQRTDFQIQDGATFCVSCKIYFI